MKVEWRELAIYKGFKIMCQFVDGYAMEAVCERFPVLKEEDEDILKFIHHNKNNEESNIGVIKNFNKKKDFKLA